ncbi:MAG: restriction endonuclease [Terracidiphilus sp.]
MAGLAEDPACYQTSCPRIEEAMPIPDYQTLMLPLLKIASDGVVHSKRDTLPELASRFGLSEEEQKTLLPSGKQRIFDNRVGWAQSYLKKALLIESVQRGQFRITDRGKQVLAGKPERVDNALLSKFPEYVEFKRRARQEQVEENDSVAVSSDAETPDDLMATGYLNHRRQVEGDVLERIKSCSPEFFERLVVKLLTTMGYGGSLADAGKAIGKSGDGGIDGVIKEDRLGLEQIFIQAKRWNTDNVGRPEIQRFVGALHGKRARKGIFLTTSTFTKDAYDYANSLETKVILIDGQELAKFMFDYEVGVSTESTYAIKRIDNDFFEDEDGGNSVTN